jgi:hypothetical protein
VRENGATNVLLLPNLSTPPRSHTVQMKAWIQHEGLCRGICGKQGAVVEYTLQGGHRPAEMVGRMSDG